MSAYFVTGSGTGVGKTFTTCALAYAGRSRKVRAYKPVISGYVTQGDVDTALLREALGTDIDDASLSPWRFEAPLSPHMAAAREGRSLSVAELEAWTKDVRNGSLCFIETVGGLMVPLNAQETTRDWMARAGLPLVMVTGNYLGALSHTLSTMEAARNAGMRVAALVVNECADSHVDLEETTTTFKTFLADIPLIIAQPRVSSYKEATAIHALLEHFA